MKTKIDYLWDKFISLFRVIITTIAIIVLAAAIYFLGSGSLHFFAKEKPAPEFQEYNPPPISANLFISTLNETKTKEESNSSDKDTYEVQVEEQLLKLWPLLDNYQNSCNVNPKVEKDTFIQSFPKSVLRNWLLAYGNDFFVDQVKFVGEVLRSKEVIEKCIESKGTSQVFTKSLDWHKEQWIETKELKDKRDTESREEIENFIRSEELRVSAENAQGYTKLTFFIWTIGIFISIASLIIFSRIESNLRQIDLNKKDYLNKE